MLIHSGVLKERELRLPSSTCSTLLLHRFQSWLHDLQIDPQLFTRTTLECELYSAKARFRRFLKATPLFLHRAMFLVLILRLRCQFHRGQRLPRYQACLVYNRLLVHLH